MGIPFDEHKSFDGIMWIIIQAKCNVTQLNNKRPIPALTREVGLLEIITKAARNLRGKVGGWRHDRMISIDH